MSPIWLNIKLLFLALLLGACSTQLRAPMASAEQKVAPIMKPEAPSYDRAKAKLGTKWGEGVASNVTQVNLRRVSNKPLAVQEILYTASAVRGRELKELTLVDGRIGLSILDGNGRKLTLSEARNSVHLRGKNGERYQLHYQNYGPKTYAILATVDGLDVLNGQPGSFDSGGYVLPPYGRLVIEGFRKSDTEVAAFRFSSVDQAYVANTAAGNVANAGLIGTAVFELYDPSKKPTPPKGSAFPAQDGYAPAPQYRD